MEPETQAVADWPRILACHVIRQALSDYRHGSGSRQSDAGEFFAGWRLDVWCQLADLDPDAIRERLGLNRTVHRVA